MQPVGKATQYFLSREISSQSQRYSTVKRKLPQTNQRGTRIYTGNPFRWLLQEPTEPWLHPWFWSRRRERDRLKKQKTKNTEYKILIWRKWKSEGKWVHSITISHSRGTEKIHHCPTSIIWSHYWADECYWWRNRWVWIFHFLICL